MKIENMYSLASQVSALATLSSLPFGKATHASVVSFASEKKGFFILALHVGFSSDSRPQGRYASKSATASGILRTF